MLQFINVDSLQKIACIMPARIKVKYDKFPDLTIEQHLANALSTIDYSRCSEIKRDGSPAWFNYMFEIGLEELDMLELEKLFDFNLGWKAGITTHIP